MRWLGRTRMGRRSEGDGELLRRSLLAALDRDWSTVEDCLGQLVRANSRDVEAYLALGRVYRNRGEIGRAISLHQTLILRPDLDARQHRDALAELAADFGQGGFTRRAIAAYDEVLEHDKRSADALRALVDLLVEAGEPERAWKLLRRLERVEGRATPLRRAEVMREIALRARNDGRMEAARRAIRKATRLDPEYVEATLLAAELDVERKQVARALGSWQRALDLAPERAAGLLEQIAHATLGAGQQPLYEEMLRERRVKLPNDATTALALARLLFDTDRPDEARGVLLDLVGRDPDDVAAHVALGRLVLADSAPEDDGELARSYGALLDAIEAGRKREEEA